jgi:hypothetical protein
VRCHAVIATSRFADQQFDGFLILLAQGAGGLAPCGASGGLRLFIQINQKIHRAGRYPKHLDLGVVNLL